MKKYMILFMILIFAFNLSADTRLWQSDWYLGGGTYIADSTFGNRFSRAESLNTENHMIVFSSNEIEPMMWFEHVLYDGDETGSHYQFPVWGDIDGDEHLDFLGLEAQALYWYETDGDFDRWTRTLLQDFGGETGNGGNAKIRDIDLDGDNDIICAVEAGMYIFYNNGDGDFTLDTLESPYGYHEVEIVDLDLNGMPDILTAGLTAYGSTGVMFAFMQDSSGDFTARMIDSRSGHWRINSADFNGDGYPDIFCSGWDVQCFINDGDGTFTQTFEMGIDFHSSESFDGSGIADLDKDGDIDFMAVTSSDSGLYVIYNDGDGYIDSLRSYPEYPRSYADACIAGDVDLDGDYDVIGGNNNVGMGLRDGPEFTFHTIGDISNSHHVEAFKRDYECGVMMHVLTRSNDGYKLFENRMLSFRSAGFLESSVLDLAYGMYPRTFGWVDCVPEGFEVDYSYRYGDTHEACTTAAFIPIEASGDPVEGGCGGYFQYRIDFTRTDGPEDQSPRVDSVYLDVSGCGCIVEFDSMTFVQDTICDGEQWIEFCYNIIPTCQDSAYDIEMIASSDGGASWDVPLETIVDTSGAIGTGVRRDWYCARWNMTEDLPDFAGDMLFKPIAVGGEVMAIIDTREFSFYIDGVGPQAFGRISPRPARPLGSMSIYVDSLRDNADIDLAESYMIIEGCEMEDSISLIGTSDGSIIHIDIPYVDCDSAMVIFHMVDGFCNHAEDTFYFDVVNQPPEINPCHSSTIALFYGDTLERPISTIDETDTVAIDIFTDPPSEIEYSSTNFVWAAIDTGSFDIYIVATDILGLSDTCIMDVRVYSTAVHEDPEYAAFPAFYVRPNPVRDRGIILLRNLGSGTIEVHNMIGETVDRIPFDAACDQIIWEPMNQVSGKYLFRLKSGEIELEKQVIIAR